MPSFDSISSGEISALPIEGEAVELASTGNVNDTVDTTLSFTNLTSTGNVNETVDAIFSNEVLLHSIGNVNETVDAIFISLSPLDFESTGNINDTVDANLTTPVSLSSTGNVNDSVISYMVIPKISANVRCRWLNNNIRVRL